MKRQDYSRRFGAGEQQATSFYSVVQEALAAFGNPVVEVVLSLPGAPGRDVLPSSPSSVEYHGMSAAC